MDKDTFTVYMGKGKERLRALITHFDMGSNLDLILKAFKAHKTYSFTDGGTKCEFHCKNDERWAIVYFLPSTSRDVAMHSAALSSRFSIQVVSFEDFQKSWK